MSRKKNRSLSRSSAQKEAYDLVLIVCEGEKTEPYYFKDLMNIEKLSSVNISVISGNGSDPVSVVDTAIEKREQQAKYLPFDAIYCVIDRDKHPNFNQAINKANANSIKIIASYPSFEYWYICHFDCYRSPIIATGNKSAGDNCMSILNGYWEKAFKKEYTKNQANVYALLHDKLETAIKRAKAGLKQAQDDGELNPSTQVHELVDYLINIKTQQINKP